LRDLARRTESRSAERTDLILEHLGRQVRMLAEADRIDDALRVYRKALRDYGQDVVPFKALARDYFAFAEQHGAAHDALRHIDSTFDRYHGRPGSDYFAMVAHADLLEMMAGYYRRDGRENKAERLERDARDLRERAAERHDPGR
jgi:hypothetical protein